MATTIGAATGVAATTITSFTTRTFTSRTTTFTPDATPAVIPEADTSPAMGRGMAASIRLDPHIRVVRPTTEVAVIAPTTPASRPPGHITRRPRSLIRAATRISLSRISLSRQRYLTTPVWET